MLNLKNNNQALARATARRARKKATMNQVNDNSGSSHSGAVTAQLAVVAVAFHQ